MKVASATAALESCEQALRALLGDAAAKGDYAAVEQLAGLARAVAALVAECEGRPVSVTVTVPAAGGSGTGTRRGTAEPRKKPANEAYPQFFRRGDELVKVGWSKTEKRKYRHRAPRRVLTAAAAAVRAAGKGGRTFTGHALLPLADPDGGAFVPYQVYVALAWMKHLGLVQPIGQRGGYRLPSDQPLDAPLTAAWPTLPEWAG